MSLRSLSSGFSDTSSSRKPSLTSLASGLPQPSTEVLNFPCCLLVCSPPSTGPFQCSLLIYTLCLAHSMSSVAYA